METDTRIENSWRILEHVYTTLQMADNKAGVLMAINSVIVGFLFSSAFDLRMAFPAAQSPLDLAASPIWLLFAATLSLIASFTSALACLIGRIGWRRLPRYERFSRPPHTLIFFGRIACLPREDYVKALDEILAPSFCQDIAEQIHVLSLISTEKYRWLNLGYALLGFSLLFFALFGLSVIF